MCISNDEIQNLLKIQRRRYLARVRYALTLLDGNNKPYTRERAEREATYHFKSDLISYEDFQNRQKRTAENRYIERNGYWHMGIPDIVRIRCPIPYMPEMPLTRCLECNSPHRTTTKPR